MIPFERPLEDHKEQNDHNVLMFSIEQNVKALDRAQSNLVKSIQALQDYEIAYYKGD